MSARHTPGPWEADRFVDGWWGGEIRAARVSFPPEPYTGSPIALVLSQQVGDDAALANARLIAAAPELLAVVRDLLEFMVLAELDDEEPHVVAAREVIAKATGSAA